MTGWSYWSRASLSICVGFSYAIYIHWILFVSSLLCSALSVLFPHTLMQLPPTCLPSLRSQRLSLRPLELENAIDIVQCPLSSILDPLRHATHSQRYHPLSTGLSYLCFSRVSACLASGSTRPSRTIRRDRSSRARSRLARLTWSLFPPQPSPWFKPQIGRAHV